MFSIVYFIVSFLLFLGITALLPGDGFGGLALLVYSIIFYEPLLLLVIVISAIYKLKKVTNLYPAKVFIISTLVLQAFLLIHNSFTNFENPLDQIMIGIYSISLCLFFLSAFTKTIKQLVIISLAIIVILLLYLGISENWIGIIKSEFFSNSQAVVIRE